MKKRALIIGGSGFIGSHLADELLQNSYEVRILDSLIPQVHGAGSGRPAYLSRDAELVVGDVRDKAILTKALRGIDVVVHFAAMVGVGQSMYAVSDYTSVNDLGTATLMEALIAKPVERVLVASSMSIYGEGLYRDASGQPVEIGERSAEQMAQGRWDLADGSGRPLSPLPTPETKRPNLASIYALSKYVQERMCLMVGKAYKMDAVALRFFNVYGTRQALSNPYTGVLAIFASRLLNGRPPMIFEDGEQRRDFVHVADVARACRLALEAPEASGRVFNIGSGESITVREVAERLAAVMGHDGFGAEITGRCRTGDIRHCFADISLARDVLGFVPQVGFDAGLAELAEWLSDQIAIDQVEAATRELASRGLVA